MELLVFVLLLVIFSFLLNKSSNHLKKGKPFWFWVVGIGFIPLFLALPRTRNDFYVIYIVTGTSIIFNSAWQFWEERKFYTLTRTSVIRKQRQRILAPIVLMAVWLSVLLVLLGLKVSP